MSTLDDYLVLAKEAVALRAELAALQKELAQTRLLVRLEHLPEHYDISDEATTELAVQCAKLEQELAVYQRQKALRQ